jgi:hypothetical protein
VLTALWPYAHVADVQRSVERYGHAGLMPAPAVGPVDMPADGYVVLVGQLSS